MVAATNSLLGGVQLGDPRIVVGAVKAAPSAPQRALDCGAPLVVRRVPDDPATGRAFARINAVEWIAVAAVAFTLARLHLDAYLMCAITAIVGLHMFPLARLFRYWPHYVAGAVMLAWAAASALMTPVGQLQGTSALGTGMILWLSAAVTLALAIPASLQREDAPAR